MPTKTEAVVREMFRLATQQELTQSLRTGDDWKQFHAIAKQSIERTTAEKEAFRQDYPKRIAEARQILLREENGRPFRPPPPPQGVVIRSERARIDQIADARVRRDHAHRLVVIQTDETDQYSDLREAVRIRDTRQGQAKTAFNRTQMRSGPTRQR